jgi:hypothetical protein
MLGHCKLCRRDDVDLQQSHYMPAALYPKKINLEYLSREGVRPLTAEIMAPLLCFDCEQRFSRNGESEVLRYIAGKIVDKPNPLLAKLELLVVREEDDSLKSYYGLDAGLNMDMFAYFALSMVWRSTHSWPVPGGGNTKPLRFGAFEAPIRRFLAGESADFPSDISVAVIVCTDKLSREAWFLPEQFDEVWYHNCRFLAFGVTFRVAMGKSMPSVLRNDSCHAAGKRIHVGDASKKTREALAYMENRSC